MFEFCLLVYAVAKVSLNYKKTKRGGKYMLTALI